MKILEVLNREFLRFNENQNPGNAMALNCVKEAMRSAKHFVSADKPIEYRPLMWIRDEPTGKWRKRKKSEEDLPVEVIPLT